MTNNFDLIGALRTYSTSNGIKFIAGADAYVNAIADYTTYDANQYILIADLSLDLTFGGAVINNYSYNGTLALGRKCEETTTASLDETFEQKYDRRLLELSQKLANIIKEFSCYNDATVERCSIKYDINKFDLNADFVACDFVISFE